MTDKPALLSAVPTAKDEMLAAVEVQLRVIRAMAAHATEVAGERRKLFLAYQDAGFTEDQALTLVRGGMLL